MSPADGRAAVGEAAAAVDRGPVGGGARVLLADDHTVLREGLRRSLEAAGLEVVGEAGDGASAVALAEKVRPDVVLMDVSLPVQDGIEATRQLRRRRPEVAVVMLTMFADGATLREALDAGAVGYLVKDCTTAEIVETVTAVASGDTALSAELAGSFLAAGRGEATPEHALTPREVEVLQLLARGSSTAQVATELFIEREDGQEPPRPHLREARRPGPDPGGPPGGPARDRAPGVAGPPRSVKKMAQRVPKWADRPMVPLIRPRGHWPQPGPRAVGPHHLGCGLPSREGTEP